MKDWQSISFWRRELPFAVEDIRVKAIHTGNSGSNVYRVFLSGKGSMPNSVIVKQTQIPNHRSIICLDDNCWQREALFYQLVEKFKPISTAKLYYCDINETEKSNLLILEDLTGSYYIPDSNYRWNSREKAAILEAYVALHSFSKHLKQSKIKIPFLAAPEYTHTTPVDLIESIRLLSNWQPANEFIGCLIETLNSIMTKLNQIHSVFKTLPTTLSYNDFYPPNIALPYGEGPAILFDFQLIGWGSALNNMLNAFGSPSFGQGREKDQLEYLKAVRFKNNTSFTLKQLIAINNILSSLYMIWVMGNYAKYFPENNRIPEWFTSIGQDLPAQYSEIAGFM